jgi:hypothetical protein
MKQQPDRWTLEGFLNHFQAVHHTMNDHPFCWIIGAGASKSSGIPTGGELVDWWLKDLHARECHDCQPLEKWATAASLGIRDFSYSDRASFYPRVFERRFSDFADEGYAYLEYVMTGMKKRRGIAGLEPARPERIIEPAPRGTQF